jgi:hypothetical protein
MDDTRAALLAGARRFLPGLMLAAALATAYLLLSATSAAADERGDAARRAGAVPGLTSAADQVRSATERVAPQQGRTVPTTPREAAEAVDAGRQGAAARVDGVVESLGGEVADAAGRVERVAEGVTAQVPVVRDVVPDTQLGSRVDQAVDTVRTATGAVPDVPLDPTGGPVPRPPEQDPQLPGSSAEPQVPTTDPHDRTRDRSGRAAVVVPTSVTEVRATPESASVVGATRDVAPATSVEDRPTGRDVPGPAGIAPAGGAVGSSGSTAGLGLSAPLPESFSVSAGGLETAPVHAASWMPPANADRPGFSPD